MNRGLITLLGGTFDNGGHPLTNAGAITGFGSLRTGGLTNSGAITFTGGPSSVTGGVTNTSGGEIHAQKSPVVFSGDVVNHGVFKSTDASMTFSGSYTENGRFISDPADNFFTDLIVGTNGSLVGGVGDRFFVSGDLFSASEENLAWQTSEAALRLAGGDGNHSFSLNGFNFGPDARGYADNFAFGIFSLAAGERLTLLDAGAPGGALYVRTLILDAGLAGISSVESSGLSIYYDPAASGNAYLGGSTYPLHGGGLIAPVPEPGSVLLLAIGTAAAAAIRHRRPSTNRG